MKTLALATLAATAALAEGPRIEIVDVEQDNATRLVKVQYKLTGGDGIVTFDATVNDVSIGDAHTTFCTGDIHKLITADDNAVRSFTWNARKAWPDVEISDQSFKVVLNAWDPSCPPDYMVVWPGTGNVNYYTSEANLPDGGLTNEVYKTTRIVMRKIEAGSFMMGTDANELAQASHVPEEVRHKVNLTQDYYIGIFPVTQGQWSLDSAVVPYADVNNAGAAKPAANMTMANIGYSGTSMEIADGSYLAALRSRSGLDFCMPTEAQWERACKAQYGEAYNVWNDGSKILGSVSGTTDDNLAQLAWYSDNSGGVFHDVGLLKPNDWGLYDMHGNLAEAVRDMKHRWTTSEETDPLWTYTGSENQRVNKGGYYRGQPSLCRSSWRGGVNLDAKDAITGFRLACAIPANL